MLLHRVSAQSAEARVGAGGDVLRAGSEAVSHLCRSAPVPLRPLVTPGLWGTEKQHRWDSETEVCLVGLGREKPLSYLKRVYRGLMFMTGNIAKYSQTGKIDDERLPSSRKTNKSLNSE